MMQAILKQNDETKESTLANVNFNESLDLEDLKKRLFADKKKRKQSVMPLGGLDIGSLNVGPSLKRSTSAMPTMKSSNVKEKPQQAVVDKKISVDDSLAIVQKASQLLQHKSTSVGIDVAHHSSSVGANETKDDKAAE